MACDLYKDKEPSSPLHQQSLLRCHGILPLVHSFTYNVYSLFIRFLSLPTLFFICKFAKLV